MLLNYLKITLRLFLQQRLYNVINIIGLAMERLPVRGMNKMLCLSGVHNSQWQSGEIFSVTSDQDSQ